MLNLAKTGTLQAPLPYWIKRHQDRKYSDSITSLSYSFGFLMKKRSYPKALDLNNVIISFHKSNTGVCFLDTIFSSHLLEELWYHKDFVLWETGFARGTLHSALRTTGSARFHEHSCIQSPSQNQVQDLNFHLWCCVFLYFLSWGDSGPPKHCVHTSQHSTAELSPGFGATGKASVCNGKNVREQT